MPHLPEDSDLQCSSILKVYQPLHWVQLLKITSLLQAEPNQRQGPRRSPQIKDRGWTTKLVSLGTHMGDGDT
jgi:hypothetical protein